jgi:hypothetical protein
MPQTKSLEGTGNPRIGLFGLANRAGALPVTAEFDYFAITPDDTATAPGPSDEFDGPVDAPWIPGGDLGPPLLVPSLVPDGTRGRDGDEGVGDMLLLLLPAQTTRPADSLINNYRQGRDGFPQH